MSQEDLDEFVNKNSEMLSRVLAILANCEGMDSVEDVEEQLGCIKLELA